MPNAPHTSLANKRVLVMGLGRFGGGIGVSQWLAQQGALVTVTDSAKPEDLADSVKALDGLPITFKLGGHDLADFLNTDLLVINPAVDRAKSSLVQAALQKQIPTTTEMNLFLERCPALTVGITGSVGKSTTTALIYEALKAALKSQISNPEIPKVHLGGNIGRSLLLDLADMGPQDIVVLELSSFMLDETPAIGWSPHIAVVTNVFENHLDRHGTMAAYSAAKQNILRFQTARDVAILNADHDLVARWVHLARAKMIKFTTRGPATRRLEMAMPGEHNQSNAAAAIAVLDALAAENIPLDRPAALHAVTAYPGLPHRLQLVHAEQLPPPAPGTPISGLAGTPETPAPPPRTIRFFNDSKATSPDASITALHAFPPGTAVFIVGGYDKHIDMSHFFSLLAQHAAGVIGIGQTGDAMVQAVRRAAGATPAAPATHYAGTLESAVALARQWAHANPRITAIVLSPASASWGQFPNYEKRGDDFARLSRAAGLTSPDNPD